MADHARRLHDSAVKVLGDDTQKAIGREPVETVRKNVCIDWTVKMLTHDGVGLGFTTVQRCWSLRALFVRAFGTLPAAMKI